MIAALIAAITITCGWLNADRCEMPDTAPIATETVTRGYDYATDSVLMSATDDLDGSQRLDVVFDEWSGIPAWLGDASLATADGICADMGGTPQWDLPVMVCEDIDY